MGWREDPQDSRWGPPSSRWETAAGGPFSRSGRRCYLGLGGQLWRRKSSGGVQAPKVRPQLWSQGKSQGSLFWEAQTMVYREPGASSQGGPPGAGQNAACSSPVPSALSHPRHPGSLDGPGGSFQLHPGLRCDRGKSLCLNLHLHVHEMGSARQCFWGCPEDRHPPIPEEHHG